jgi:TPR repeat protein
MKKIITTLVFLYVCAYSLSAGATSEALRLPVNRAPQTENSTAFLKEKQQYDRALHDAVDFYSLDSWYFAGQAATQAAGMRQNAADPANLPAAVSEEDAFAWYLHIADGTESIYASSASYAQYIAACCYAYGYGTVYDYHLARTFLQRSLAAGFAGAYNLAANGILSGWYTDPDGADRSSLYLRAAEQNFPAALVNAARELIESRTENTGTAPQQISGLLHRAQHYNSASAFYMESQYICSSAHASSDTPPETAAEILKKIVPLLEKSAGLFYPEAALDLGCIYAHKRCTMVSYNTLCENSGNPFPADEIQAVTYDTLAAACGNEHGYEALAAIYRTGIFGTPDSGKAAAFYRQYKDIQYSRAQRGASRMERYVNGFENGGQKPDAFDCNKIGKYYAYRAAKINAEKALSWLTRGADNGSASCMGSLVLLYDESIGVYPYKGKKKNQIRWIKKALAETTEPLSDEDRTFYQQKLSKLYQPAVCGKRFYNDELYWQSLCRNDSYPYKTTFSHPEISSAENRQEALEYFRSRVQDGSPADKTFYAWLLIEDFHSVQYGIQPLHRNPRDYGKEAWKIINNVLSEAPSYAPAVVCKGRCLEYGFGTKQNADNAAECYSQAADMQYGQAYGYIAMQLLSAEHGQNPQKEDAAREYILKGCNLKDEISLYLAVVTGTDTGKTAEVNLSLSSDYGYQQAYPALLQYYLENGNMTDPLTQSRAYTAAENAVNCRISGMEKQRNQLEKQYENTMYYGAPHLKYALRAAEKTYEIRKDIPSLVSLAKAYADAGNLVPDAKKKAADCYTTAAESGNTEAMLVLADYCTTGDGIEKSDRAAFRWRLKAAQTDGSENAYMQLATAYLDGTGCERDVEKGLSILRRFKATTTNSCQLQLLSYYEGIPDKYETADTSGTPDDAGEETDTYDYTDYTCTDENDMKDPLCIQVLSACTADSDGHPVCSDTEGYAELTQHMDLHNDYLYKKSFSEKDGTTALGLLIDGNDISGQEFTASLVPFALKNEDFDMAGWYKWLRDSTGHRIWAVQRIQAILRDRKQNDYQRRITGAMQQTLVFFFTLGEENCNDLICFSYLPDIPEESNQEGSEYYVWIRIFDTDMELQDEGIVQAWLEEEDGKTSFDIENTYSKADVLKYYDEMTDSIPPELKQVLLPLSMS